jgi:phosphate transport system substrate-binding protein
VITTTPKRLGAFVIAAAFAFAACSSSGSSSAPESAAASGAASAAPASAAALPSVAAPTACETGSIVAAGSTALQPLVDAGGKIYVAGCTGSTISVQGGGSGTGLTQVLQGAVQIGNSDVTADSKLKPDEASQLVNHDVARQGWIMVNNKDVTGVTNLTSQQATDIWTGKTTNWKDVGGPDEPIVLILRPESSGTRATFKKIVLNGATEATGQALTEDSNGAVIAAVGTTPGSTSVVGFAFYQSNKDAVTGLQLDGVDATTDNMTNGTYKLQAIGHMYTKGEATGLAKSFIDYMLSPAVQTTLLPALYYAPVGS